MYLQLTTGGESIYVNMDLVTDFTALHIEGEEPKTQLDFGFMYGEETAHVVIDESPKLIFGMMGYMAARKQ